MATTDVMTPYSTVVPLLATLPTWVPESEQERIGAYQKYEEIYWNVPDCLKLVRRGMDDKPIYIPNPRTICDTTSHFLLKGLSIGYEDPEANQDASNFLAAFLRRERFYSKLAVAKHSGVVRGDAVIHLTADPNQPASSRLSLVSVDPAQYFPIYNDDDLDKIEGVHLVDQFYDATMKKTLVKRLTYRYLYKGATRVVTREEAIFELDKWSQGDATPLRVTYPLAEFPPPIDTIPVYHLKNIDWQGQPFGSSELRGYETLVTAIDQGASDEQLALTLEGLGVYATDSEAPVDEDGNDVAWDIAGGKVLELSEGSVFNRVPGITSVAPMLDHLKYLEERLFESTGTFRPGHIDVQVAQSGVALAIKFMPMLAKIEERDFNGLDVLNNLFYDWTRWVRVYEGFDYQALQINASLGEKLPVDRAAKVDELLKLAEKKIISAQYMRAELEKLGYDFPDDMEAQILAETSKQMDAQDLAGNRIATEVADEATGTGEATGEGSAEDN